MISLSSSKVSQKSSSDNLRPLQGMYTFMIVAGPFTVSHITPQILLEPSGIFYIFFYIFSRHSIATPPFPLGLWSGLIGSESSVDLINDSKLFSAQKLSKVDCSKFYRGYSDIFIHT